MNNLTNKSLKKNNKPLIVIGILAVLVAALAFLILTNDKRGQEKSLDNYSVDEINNQNEESVVYNSESEEVEVISDITGAVVAVSGGNLVTRDNIVVNEQGQVVQNNAVPMTATAPKLSAPLKTEEIPATAIQLSADSEGFRPAEFRVKASQPVTLALTAIGVSTRLVFKDSSLAALELTVPADYTMAKTFNAPSASGEYIFYQDMPGRFQQTGKMIVE